MAVETAEDLDCFFDVEEFGESAVFTAPGGVPVDIVVVRDESDERLPTPRGITIGRVTHLLIRADAITPVSRARVDLIDAARIVTASFVIQGDPSLEPPGGTWRCPAVAA